MPVNWSRKPQDQQVWMLVHHIRRPQNQPVWMLASHHVFLTHPMEMPAFNWIILPHVTLPVPDIITVIIKVVVAVIIVYTIPREAILMTDATKATPERDLSLT